jgi:hypothetical protein
LLHTVAVAALSFLLTRPDVPIGIARSPRAGMPAFRAPLPTVPLLASVSAPPPQPEHSDKGLLVRRLGFIGTAPGSAAKSRKHENPETYFVSSCLRGELDQSRVNHYVPVESQITSK